MLCTVRTDGKSAGEVNAGVSLRRDWPDPVDSQTREVLYSPFPPEGDPLHQTAERIRRHVIDDLGKKPVSVG